MTYDVFETMRFGVTRAQKITDDTVLERHDTAFAVEQIARAAHEVNRAYCAAINDPVQPVWEEAPDWQRESARNGVLFHLRNPEASPSASHENWLREKVANGWRYGEVKDEGAKTHPCCLPFDNLPEKQKAKDYLFRAVVHSHVHLLLHSPAAFAEAIKPIATEAPPAASA